MSKQRKPFLKFRPDAWLNDERLLFCSAGAHGLWINMIARMHQSEEYGVLIIDGKPPSMEEMGVLFRWGVGTIEPLLGELKARCVVRVRDEDGALYSERMIRDFEAGELGREHIQKRWKDKEKPAATHPNRVASRRPNTKNQESRIKNPPNPQSTFDDAWKIWPKHVRASNKAKSKAKWEAAESAHDPADVLAAAKAYLSSPDAMKADDQNRKHGYVKAMEAWLNSQLDFWLERIAEKKQSVRARSRHQIAAPPPWFANLGERFAGAYEAEWSAGWSRCVPVSEPTLESRTVILRAHSPEFYSMVTRKGSRAVEKFKHATGYDIELLPPERTSTR